VEDVLAAIVPLEGKEPKSLTFSRTGFYVVSQVEIEFRSSNYAIFRQICFFVAFAFVIGFAILQCLKKGFGKGRMLGIFASSPLIIQEVEGFLVVSGGSDDLPRGIWQGRAIRASWSSCMGRKVEESLGSAS
jgi:hypothetical protein